MPMISPSLRKDVKYDVENDSRSILHHVADCRASDASRLAFSCVLTVNGSHSMGNMSGLQIHSALPIIDECSIITYCGAAQTKFPFSLFSAAVQSGSSFSYSSFQFQSDGLVPCFFLSSSFLYTCNFRSRVV